LIAAYADIGISCLTIWEGELKSDAGAVAKRIQDFIAAPSLIKESP
jgi:hypothetical protein